MRTLLVALVSLTVLVALAIGQRVYHIPRLPDQVAAHIGLSGEVDQWQDRDTAVSESRAAVFVLTGIFMGITALCVQAVRILPEWLVNLPRKDYWLSTPGRRNEAAVIVLGFMLGVYAAGVGFWIVLTEEIVQASVTGRGGSYALPAVLVLVMAILAQIVWLVIRLRRPRGSDAQPSDGPSDLNQQ